ncbi:MAG TPA: nitroreductase family protein [Candidatus Limnocylindrales bacterium]|nr:nitroreductase family protein [Candidatus Limnocylindrales bacterium]
MSTAEKKAHPDVPIHALIADRWSPYCYSTKPVPESDLRAILEAARWAPSSYNEQPWRYILARSSDAAAHAKLVSCLVEGNQAWAKNAPVLMIGIAVMTFSRNGKPNRAAQHDLGLAAGNICIEATARGLFVHQMIGIVPERVRELYRVPPEAEPLTGLAIGYLGDETQSPEALRERDRAPRTRKPIADIVFEETWQHGATV